MAGVFNFFGTWPGLILIDKIGRRPLLMAGGLGMSTCLLIVGILTAKFHDSWEEHPAAGWAACVFVWLYLSNFAYSWGPCSWTVISEVMPLSARSAGTALGASTNWVSLADRYTCQARRWLILQMVNFAVSFFVPPMLDSIGYGTCE